MKTSVVEHAPGTRPLELLEREITELASQIHAATCRWLGLIEEFDRREGWAQWGCKSCAQWISHYCAVSPATAREHVHVAGRLAELPAIRSAFGRGGLSYSQVRALSRVATPELEPELLELARHATAAQLERVLRAYRGVLGRELSRDDAVHGERNVICEHDDDGSVLIRARLPAEEGALVMTALEEGRRLLHGQASSEGRGVSAEAEAPPAVASTELTDPPGIDERQTERGSVSNADSLLLMAESLLPLLPPIAREPTPARWSPRRRGDTGHDPWGRRPPRARASSSTARRFTLRRLDAWPATRASSGSSSAMGVRYLSAGAPQRAGFA